MVRPRPVLATRWCVAVAVALAVVGCTTGAPKELVVDTVAADVAAHLGSVAGPLASAHGELVATWAGDDLLWDAAWDSVLEDLDAATGDTVARFTSPPVTVTAVLAPFPFLFEVAAGDDRRCVAPALEPAGSFEVLPGPCADAGYDPDTVAVLLTDLGDPETARGRALVDAAYVLAERLAGGDVRAAVAAFASETGWEVVVVDADRGLVEVRDGALAVCVTAAAPDAVTADRPAPGECPTAG